MFFGFSYYKATSPPFSSFANSLQSEFEKCFVLANSNQDWWVAMAYWNEYLNWGFKEFNAIRTGQFKEDLREKLKKLVDIVNAASVVANTL